LYYTTCTILLVLYYLYYTTCTILLVLYYLYYTTCTPLFRLFTNVCGRYYTANSGKWHLGHHSWKHTPVGRGFDEFHGVLNCCAAYYSKSYFHPLYGHKIDWRNGTQAVAPAPPKHSSEEFADRLIDIISQHTILRPSQPLFMMLTLTAPHSPLQSEPRHTSMCAHVHTDRRRTFCGLMLSVDEAVARVQAAMEAADMWSNSIVAFMNDNGGNVWEGGRNYPYRGGKMSSFEGGSRATGFVKFPDGTGAPSSYDGLVHIADFMPSILGFIDRLGHEQDAAPFQVGDAELGEEAIHCARLSRPRPPVHTMCVPPAMCVTSAMCLPPLSNT